MGAQPKLGVQLYTLREYIRNYEDTEKTFAFLRELGVNVIQISGIGDFPAIEQAELVRKYGMDVCVTHKSFERMQNDLDALIDEHLLLGCDSIGIGGMPTCYRGSLEGAKAFIKEAERIGKHMRKRGVRFNYHNHDFEFLAYDGRRVMDVLIEDSDPELIWFVPDVAWMQIAGENPAQYIKKMQNRIKVLHFKDFIKNEDGRQFTEIGLGQCDLAGCYKACVEMGVPYIVYEQDSGFAVNALESTKVSFENMKKIALENA